MALIWKLEKSHLNSSAGTGRATLCGNGSFSVTKQSACRKPAMRALLKEMQIYVLHAALAKYLHLSVGL